jgi:hypothetical protein
MKRRIRREYQEEKITNSLKFKKRRIRRRRIVPTRRVRRDKKRRIRRDE